MTPLVFVKTVERALRYRIDEMETLRRIALLYLDQGEEEALPSVEVDEGFRQREAYLEGRLTEAPDLAVYDKMLEDDEDG